MVLPMISLEECFIHKYLFCLQGHVTGARSCCRHVTEQNILLLGITLFHVLDKEVLQW